MLSTARSGRLAQAVREACETEIRALKPGNVGLHGDGHGMSADDFLISAEAIAEPLTVPGRSVGGRILAAIEATRRVVPCNTNLGIVLLCAPLAHAALQARGVFPLRLELEHVLARLDVADAELAFTAIRLANPGGLGEAPQYDVRQPARVSLQEAMRAASGRDSIARQYASGFADIFDIGVGFHRQCHARWRSEEWATLAVYLRFMARWPDSHVQRKHGEPVARALGREAAAVSAELLRTSQPERLRQRLLEWDERLKRQGINPGTSADLSVACLFAARAEEMLEEEFNAAEPNPDSAANQPWDRGLTQGRAQHANAPATGSAHNSPSN